MPTLRIKNDQENAIHFLTITVIEWIDIFTKPEYFKVIIDSLAYCRQNKGLMIYGYVIMANHLHLIIEASAGSELSQIISDFKKHTTREIWKLLETDNRHYIVNILNNSFHKKKGYVNQIWQRENCPEIIYTQEFLMTKIKYIHNNPVRKNYVSKPEDWFYSSARNWIINSNDETALAIDFKH